MMRMSEGSGLGSARRREPSEAVRDYATELRDLAFVEGQGVQLGKVYQFPHERTVLDVHGT